MTAMKSESIVRTTRLHSIMTTVLMLFVFLMAFSGTAVAAVNPQVAVGSYHSTALKNDGTVWAWGDNEQGQLGDGSTIDHVTPQPVSGLTDIIAIASGDSHTLAVKSDGTVWAWGYNGFGQLGDGTLVDRNAPQQVPGLNGMIAVAAGGHVSLALKNDGSVWVWGRNDFGQLGDGTSTQRTSPQQVAGLSGITALATGGYHSVALKGDGTLWAWGMNDFGQLGDNTTLQQTAPRQVAGFNGVKAIAAGIFHTVAVKTDGTVWAWGDNQYNQLGDGTINQSLTPKKVNGLTGIGAIAAGGYYTAALQNGVVWTWGDNDNGQLGDGTTSRQNTPVQIVGLTAICSIAAGSYHTVALKNDGVIFAWGDNEFGQLGTGSTTAHPAPYLVAGIMDAISISAGGYHSIAVKGDGTVWAWGDNQYGQLGDGSTADHATPQQTTGLTGITAVAAGESHTMALKNDGTVWVWGDNSSGQLGDGSTVQRNIPQQVSGLVNITAIAAGGQHSIALDNNGKVWIWGGNIYGQLGDGTTAQQATPFQLTGLSGITAIAAGKDHTLVLKDDGTVHAWGDNSNGQLGDGTKNQRTSAVEVSGLGTVSTIDAGGYHSTAVNNDGAIWTWGYNIYGQLGVNGITDHSTPVQVSLDNAATVGAGSWHTVALRNDATVWSWGLNEDGQLGNDATVTAYNPVEVTTVSGITAIGAGEGHTVALKSDGSVWVWGSNTYGQVGDDRNLNPGIATGLNLGTYPPVTVATPAGGTYYTPPVVTLAANKPATIFYTSNGSEPTITSPVYSEPLTISESKTLKYFAVDVSGSAESVKTETYTILPGHALTVVVNGAGNGTVSYSTGDTCTANCSQSFAAGMVITLDPLPGNGSIFTGWSGCDQVIDGRCSVTMTAAKNVTAAFDFVPVTPMVAAGDVHTVVLKNDGTVWAWGYNYNGRLGDGTTIQRNSPIQVSGLTGITAIDAGADHTVALKNDGTVWTWGSNVNGQLGDGTTSSHSIPIQVAGLTGITAVAAGGYHTLALKNDGTVWTWGYNFNGQLGDGSTFSRYSPIQITGLTGIRSITAGGSHSLVLKNDGTVWTWGHNGSGQLGDNTTTQHIIPTRTATGLSGITAIAAGGFHSHALLSDGTIWSWGDNSSGQLGDGTTTSRYIPVKTNGISGISFLDAGRYHIVALKNDGTVWAWGYNYYGQIGDGTKVTRTIPVMVTGLTGIKAIAAGGYHTAALKNDGTVWAWGNNGNGQLGDGTTISRLTATKSLSINLGTTLPLTTISPLAGTYGAPVTVTLIVNEPAIIYYTNDGSDPETSPTRMTYTQSIFISSTTTLKYYAADLAGHNETVKTAVYTINDTTPPVTSVSTPGGTYATPRVVTLTANEPATIYYTTNGSDPVTSPTKGTYSGPVNISFSTMLKYYAQDIAGNIEAVKTATYIINPPITTASPPAGTYAAPQVVTLTANQPATIYYTSNGQEPTTASPIYSGPLTISTPKTLKYFAKVAGGASETVKTAVYVIKPPVTTISPPGGTYATAQSVTLTANQPATIYYTSNGLEPTTSSPVYSGPLTIATSKTLKYFSKVAGGMSETVKTTVYIIKQNQNITFNTLPAKKYNDPDFTLSATASSGLTTSYTSSNTAVATISGNTVTIVGVGTTTITASQGGNGEYNPAPDVSRTLTVNKAAATVTLGSLSATYDGSTKAISATTVPVGLTVVITYAGSTTAPIAAGNYAVVATVDNANYEGNATGTLAIAKADQTITFNALPAKMYGDPSFTLSAAVSSGLGLSYTSSNTSVATVSGSTVTMVGPGTTTISAIQNGDNNYNAATPATQNLTVNFLQLSDNGSSTYFTSLSSAFNAIASGTNTAIRLLAGTLTETVVFDRDYTVTLSGGYGSSFAAQTGVTFLRGSLTFKKGTAIIDGPISIM